MYMGLPLFAIAAVSTNLVGPPSSYAGHFLRKSHLYEFVSMLKSISVLDDSDNVAESLPDHIVKRTIANQGRAPVLGRCDVYACLRTEMRMKWAVHNF